MANETNIPNPAEMSKEEMEKKRKEIHAYYKSTIPSLKTQQYVPDAPTAAHDRGAPNRTTKQ